MDSVLSAPFSNREDQFLLNLIQCPLFSGDSETRLGEVLVDDVDWVKLEKAYFLLPYLYLYTKKYKAWLQPPAAFVQAAKKVYLHNFVLNTKRLHTITELSKGMTALGEKLVFIKGAAELIALNHHEAFTSSRLMGDLDVLCEEASVLAIHEEMLRNGYEIYDFNGCLVDSPSLIQGSLERIGHIVYNVFTPKHIELHTQVAIQDNLKTYPPDFSETVRVGAKKVKLGGLSVLIPKREHMLVYMICHMACLKDHQVMIHAPNLGWDHHWSERQVETFEDLIHSRFEVHQLRYLFQLRAFLEASLSTPSGGIDFKEVHALLAQVEERRILEGYLNLAGSYLGSLFPMASGPSRPDSLLPQRQSILDCVADYVFTY